MLTRCLPIDGENPQPEFIEQAATLIKKGELVAFPTETVYGLGADAYNSNALQKVFAAKGRPQDRTLLVAVSNLEQVAAMVTTISPDARLLIHTFWPGPLSIIMPGVSGLPSEIRSENGGIGFRMPAHPVAIALIEKAGPIVAPSANLYGRPSPVEGTHVLQDMNGRISAVLDAGLTGTGMESTLLDACGAEPVILRRGGVPVETIEKVLNKKVIVQDSFGNKNMNTPCEVVMSSDEMNFRFLLKQLREANQKVGIIYNDSKYKSSHVIGYALDTNKPAGSFYYIVRDAEEKKLDVLLVAPLHENQAGELASVLDRIKRAAGRTG